jgi:hypothetical protein
MSLFKMATCPPAADLRDVALKARAAWETETNDKVKAWIESLSLGRTLLTAAQQGHFEARLLTRWIKTPIYLEAELQALVRARLSEVLGAGIEIGEMKSYWDQSACQLWVTVRW